MENTELITSIKSSRTVSPSRQTGGLLKYTISCSISLENKIAELYERVSTSLPSFLAEILLHVARESRNHAKFFQALSKLIGVEACECKGNKIVSHIDELLEKTRGRELSLGDVRDILSECVDLEKTVGEEYNVKILSQVIRMNLKTFSRNISGLEGFRTVLEEISMEENYHSSLVRYVLESLEAMTY